MSSPVVLSCETPVVTPTPEESQDVDTSGLDIDDAILARRLHNTRFFPYRRLGVELNPGQETPKTSSNSRNLLPQPDAKRPKHDSIQPDTVMCWMPGTGGDPQGSLEGGRALPAGYQPIPQVEDPYIRVVLGTLDPRGSNQKA
jgi:hypothetical protein